MKNFLSKNLVIFLILILASCSSKEGDKKSIRIVDLQGNHHAVKMKVPPLNSKALIEQGKLNEVPLSAENSQENITDSQPTRNVQSPSLGQQNFAEISSNLVQETLQMPQKKSENQLATIEERPQEKVVEYDMSQPEEEIEFIAKSKKEDEQEVASKKKIFKTTSKKAKTDSVKVEKAKSGGKKFYAQAGAFANKNGAELMVKKLQNFHQGKVEMVEGERVIYRALLGPFSNRKQANLLIKKLNDSGYEAVLVRGN